MQPPKLEKIKKTHTFHSYEIEDDWHYLEKGWQEIVKDPTKLPKKIKDYIAAENKYADEYLKDTKEIQDTLWKIHRGRIKEDETSVEIKHKDYFYYSRYRKKNKDQGHYSIACRKHKTMKAPEEIIYDGDDEAKGNKYFSYTSALSLNQDKLAIGTDTTGNEEYLMTVRDIKTKKILTNQPIKTSGNFFFAKNDWIYYTVLDKERRPFQVKRHTLGDDPKNDIVIYTEKDPSFFVSAGLSHDDKFIYIDTSQHDTDEVYFFECDEKFPKPRLIKKRELDFEYDVSYHPESNSFYILTNKDNAIDYKLMQVSTKNPEVENWKTVLEHKPGRLILGIMLIKGWLIRSQRENFNEEIIAINLNTNEEHKIEFANEDGCSIGASPVAVDYDSKDWIRVGFSSMKTEARVYDYNCKTKELVLKKKQTIPSGHDNSQNETKRILAKSKDGEVDIPITLLWKKGMLKKDGSNPCVAFHYSHYGITHSSSFSVLRLAMCDIGLVSVLINVRGSTAGGNNYYLKSKKLNKMKTFDDIISALDKIIEEKYTSKGNIVINSGSAGGMSNGYLMNNYPEYFKGVCSSVGFFTVLLTMLNPSLALTKIEEEQWGSALNSKEAFEYILKYDPYYGIKKQRYPMLYFSNSLTDPRVGWYESFKLIQKIREHDQSKNPIIIKCDLSASHGGASSRWDALKNDVIPEQAWILKLFNKHKP